MKCMFLFSSPVLLATIIIIRQFLPIFFLQILNPYPIIIISFPTNPMDQKQTIFDKILSKDIPSSKVYQDELVYAFKDIAPAAPVHIIIIPKKKDGLVGLSAAQQRHEKILGHLLLVASKIGHQEKLDKGYRIVINNGEHGCQSVEHIHVHLLGGSQCSWPPGTTNTN